MSELTWNEDLPLHLKGTKAVAFATPSEKSEYRLNKEDDGNYWVVVLIANADGKGTINYHLGDRLSREDAERVAEEDWAEGLEGERSRIK
jgi:hypothetical protein